MHAVRQRAGAKRQSVARRPVRPRAPAITQSFIPVSKSALQQSAVSSSQSVACTPASQRGCTLSCCGLAVSLKPG